MTALGCALVALATVLGSLPGRALASTTEPSIMTDDSALLYGSVARMEQSMQYMKTLGVDRVKVSMVWSLIGPGSNSRHRPHFDATNPAAYPSATWTRYDEIVQEAKQIGLPIYFQLTAPAPLWATTSSSEKSGYRWSHEPNAAEFKQFVEAVGERYSGTYIPTVADTGTDVDPTLLPASGQPLPAVKWWGIWNEPNEVGWLSPQTRVVDKRTVPYAPVLDRALTNAGYEALLATGHATSTNTILIGETASGGKTEPLPFVRALYCVATDLRPLTGGAAAALDCPRSGSRRAFVTANPGLFAATGWAHHPYSFDHPPDVPLKSRPGIVMIANLNQLENSLDGIFATYREPTGLPLYLTEWGYKSNPPNPFVHTSLSEQATWLNWGEYLTWRDPRVKALAQYLLYDQPPNIAQPAGTLAYWGTFQTGLLFSSGQPKPALAAFRLPIWLPSAHTGSGVTVWGELRPADHSASQYGVIEYEPPGSHTWNWLRIVTTTNSEGFFQVQLPIPHPGAIRLLWLSSGYQAFYSRTVAVTR
jgi:hypothetical protein